MTATNYKPDKKLPFLGKMIATATVALAALFCSPASNAQIAGASYDFLDIPTSAHAFGLGGSGIAIIDEDVTLSDQNPALIGPELNNQLAFGYMHWFGESNFASVRFGNRATKHAAWAAGVRYLDYGQMNGFDQNGTPTGSFSAQDICFEGSFSHDITNRLRGGINLNFAYSHYEQYWALAMSVDLGINYFNEEKDLSLSAVLKNMGGQLKRFDAAHSRLPFDFQLGYMQGLGSSNFSLAITASHLTRWRLPFYHHNTNGGETSPQYTSNFFEDLFRHLTFGLQYSPTNKFYICAGYNYKSASDMGNYHRNILTGFSAGVGIRVKSFGVDAGIAMPHKGGFTVLANVYCTLGELLHSRR